MTIRDHIVDCGMTSQVYIIKGPGHKDRANPPFCFNCWSHCDRSSYLSTLVFNRLSALGRLLGTEGNNGKY